MNLNDLIIWIVVGAVTGVLSNSLLSGMRIGLLGAVLIGVLGAVLGGWIFNLLDVNALIGVANEILASFLGALFCLLVFSILQRA